MSASRRVAAFVGVAYALAWLVCLPLWLDPRHLASPWTAPLATLMMLTPLVAALVVTRGDWRGLGLAPRPIGRTVRFAGVGAALVYIAVLGGLVTSSLLGRYAADLRSFSGFRAYLEQASGGRPLPAMPLGVLAVVSLVQCVVLGLVNTLPALGEEAGWRGFLWPALSTRFPRPFALLLCGVIWGCWHAPLLLLGYNYPAAPRWLAPVLMSVLCVLLGTILAWVRDRTGNSWAPAYVHGLFNALAGSAAIALSDAARPVDTVSGTVLGWAGWPVAAAVAGILVWRWAATSRGHSYAQRSR